MKVTSTAVRVAFSSKDIREALADYVDLNHHRPDLAKYIRSNKFKVEASPKGSFVIKMKAK